MHGQHVQAEQTAMQRKQDTTPAILVSPSFGAPSGKVSSMPLPGSNSCRPPSQHSRPATLAHARHLLSRPHNPRGRGAHVLPKNSPARHDARMHTNTDCTHRLVAPPRPTPQGTLPAKPCQLSHTPTHGPGLPHGCKQSIRMRPSWCSSIMPTARCRTSALTAGSSRTVITTPCIACSSRCSRSQGERA